MPLCHLYLFIVLIYFFREKKKLASQHGDYLFFPVTSHVLGLISLSIFKWLPAPSRPELQNSFNGNKHSAERHPAGHSSLDNLSNEFQQTNYEKDHNQAEPCPYIIHTCSLPNYVVLPNPTILFVALKQSLRFTFAEEQSTLAIFKYFAPLQMGNPNLWKSKVAQGFQKPKAILLSEINHFSLLIIEI